MEFELAPLSGSLLPLPLATCGGTRQELQQALLATFLSFVVWFWTTRPPVLCSSVLPQQAVAHALLLATEARPDAIILCFHADGFCATLQKACRPWVPTFYLGSAGFVLGSMGKRRER